MYMDELFDVKHGIRSRGKEYGFVGISRCMKLTNGLIIF